MPKTPKNVFRVPRKSSTDVQVDKGKNSRKLCILDELDKSPVLAYRGDKGTKLRKYDSSGGNIRKVKSRIQCLPESCSPRTGDAMYMYAEHGESQSAVFEPRCSSPQEARRAPDIETSLSCKNVNLVEHNTKNSFQSFQAFQTFQAFQAFQSSSATAACDLECAVISAERSSVQQQHHTEDTYANIYEFKLSPEAKTRCKNKERKAEKGKSHLRKQTKTKQAVLECISKMSQEIQSLRKKYRKLHKAAEDEEIELLSDH